MAGCISSGQNIRGQPSSEHLSVDKDYLQIDAPKCVTRKVDTEEYLAPTYFDGNSVHCT